MTDLYPYQRSAVNKMKNGCILCGGVGSGKSITSLFYYLENESDRDLFIITTARKRDDHEWEDELRRLDVCATIDSWNNIKKYALIKDSFFIFDEQRVVGKGAWVKSFLSICKRNHWILLSATPGDTWSDYIPVFIANGFYRNRTEFATRHIVYKRFSKFPQVDRYLEEGRLNRLRRDILVDMDYVKPNERIKTYIDCRWPRELYRELFRSRFNIYTQEPIKTASELCQCLRQAVNRHASRLEEIYHLLDAHPRVIIFYNYDYELEILRGIDLPWCKVAEWNGHKHESVPTCDRWAYLVQYNAGAEGWNCTTCDTMIFYSLNYSYKVMEQAMGRIDRVNTPYKHLYYYMLTSKAPIDIGIMRALKAKKKFNERKFLNC